MERLETHRQHWARQQQVLRQLLSEETRHEEAMRLFLDQHAMLHAGAMAETGAWSFEDEVVTGLSDEQWRLRPEGAANSIAWLLWHIARIEDVTMNLLVAGRPQVLSHGDWPARLGLARRDVGTTMGDAEVAAFSGRVDIPSLRAYRVAVGRATRAIVAALTPGDVRARVDPANIRALLAAGALAEAAAGLAETWGGRRTAGLLTMPATRHSFTHLNEARRVRQKLRR